VAGRIIPYVDAIPVWLHSPLSDASCVRCHAATVSSGARRG
jgi:hypothetical protein